MNMLGLIIAMSTIMWYVIDRFKPLWAECKNAKYITILVSAIAGFGLSFGFDLDLVYALGLVETTSTLGIVINGLVLMSGSSAIAELIERLKG